MIAECLTFRVLREHGIATGATALPRLPVAPESEAGRHATGATGATGATAQKCMEQREAPEPPQVPRRTGWNVVPLRKTVACRDCAHQLRQPDTSPAGTHDCSAGHGLHFAGERHGCADWQPT